MSQFTRGISPYTYKQRRKKDGSFRCEGPCGAVYPKSLKRRQDGKDVCSVTCYREMGLEDIAAANAQAIRDSRPIESEYEERPVLSQMMGLPLIYSITDLPQLPRLVFFQTQHTCTVTGINLSASIVFSFESDPTYSGTTTFSFGSISADGTSGTLTLTRDPASPGSVPNAMTVGDWDLHCSIRDSGPFRKSFFKVR